MWSASDILLEAGQVGVRVNLWLLRRNSVIVLLVFSMGAAAERAHSRGHVHLHHREIACCAGLAWDLRFLQRVQVRPRSHIQNLQTTSL